MHALHEIGIKLGRNMVHSLKICIYSCLHYWYMKLNRTPYVYIWDSWLCNSPTADFTIAQAFHWLRFVKLPLFPNSKIAMVPSPTVSKVCFKDLRAPSSHTKCFYL